jgi:hypothetical protein
MLMVVNKLATTNLYNGTAIEQSVNTLDAALRKQAESAVKEAVAKPKGPYSKLVAKFGLFFIYRRSLNEQL